MQGQAYEQLTLFQEGSRVSHSPSPASKKARRTTVFYGPKRCVSSAKLNRVMYYWKMYLESSISQLTMFAPTWSMLVTWSGYWILKLRLSARRIDANELPLWATPNTLDHLPPHSPEALERQKQGARKGRSRPGNLREQVDAGTVGLWATPNAADCMGSTGGGQGRSLRTDVQMFPMPRAEKIGGYANKGYGPTLAQAAMMFPTPQSRDYRTGTPAKLDNPDRQRNLNDVTALFPTPTSVLKGMTAHQSDRPFTRSGNLEAVICMEETGATEPGTPCGQLNPDWVARMMGFPDGYLDL
ncbi:hypothetical protein AGMMS49992_26760 [Clostridia bacterium]|nr:hypothetical protein AGMMS49992_26760 [Clostridia bacterium]